MNVLLIEPNKILAQAYSSELQALGIKVAWVTGAEQAIRQIDKKLPDVVVLEPKLAGHSGVEFLHEFRSYEDWHDIPVIIFSSVPEYSFGVDEAVWQKFGVERYLDKSRVSIRQLAGIIKSYGGK